MKICQFIGSMDPGGAETIVLNLTQGLLKNEIETVIVCREGSWIQHKSRSLHLPRIILPQEFEKLWSSIYSIPKYAITFRKFLKYHKFDVVHSHLFKATLYNSFACWRNFNHVATQHDSYTILEKPGRRILLKLVRAMGTKLVAVSESIKTDYDLPMDVIYNGICNKGSGDDIRNDLGLSQDTFIFTSVGRLIPLKRYDLLLKSVRKIIDEEGDKFNFVLLIVGDGPEYDNLYNLHVDLGIQKYLKFVGFKDNVDDYLELSNCFVLASETEGLSMSIIESMSHALPIITCDVGGNRELVSSANGFLLDCNSNEEQFANSMLCAMKFPYSTYNMGLESRRIANEKFSISSMMKKYIQLYERGEK